MSAWVYRARDPGGNFVRGKAEAETERDLINRLRNQGFMILQIERDRDLQTMMQSPSTVFARKISGAEIALFCRQFATMTEAGLPVVTALKVLSRQSANERLKRALAQVAADVEAGETLAAAFARQSNAFPNIMIQMIGAGEVGGILDDVMNRLAIYLEKEEQLRQKVRSAMVYPAIVSLVASLVVLFLVIFVVPRFVQIYGDAAVQLPLATRVLIGASDVAQKYWWLLGGGVLGSVVGARLWLQTEQGATQWDRAILRLPVFGPLVNKQAIARFSRTLAGLMSSGVPILKALAVVERTVGNRVVAASVRDALEDVRQGQNLVTPLRRSGIMPGMVLEMVSVGEETGTLEEMLHKIADFYEESVQRTAERLSASLEPLILVVLALVVGFVVASMMLPIFNLWSAIE